MKKALSVTALLVVIMFSLSACGTGGTASGGGRIMFFPSNWRG